MFLFYFLKKQVLLVICMNLNHTEGIFTQKRITGEIRQKRLLLSSHTFYTLTIQALLTSSNLKNGRY